MSIQSEISRISSEVTTQTDLLGQIAAELAGKAAGGDIEIQTDKEAVTPSNVAQTVWPDSGYDALAKVTVKAIPSPYFDTSEVTAGEDDVVTGKKIVSASGATINGNNPYEKTATDFTVSAQSDLILQIQTALQEKTAGGEGPDSGPYSKAEIITWTPVNDTSSIEVAHSLGVVPDGFYVIAREDIKNLENHILTLNMDIGMLYAEVYHFVTGVVYDTPFQTLIYIVTDFDGDITAQNICLGPLDSTLKGGATYEILVYKR